MTFDELAFNQRVIWTNAAGTRIEACVTDILPTHNEAQIRVRHEGGMQHLWVRPETLEPDWHSRRERALAFVRDGLKAGKHWASKPYDYQEEGDGREPRDTSVRA